MAVRLLMALDLAILAPAQAIQVMVNPDQVQATPVQAIPVHPAKKGMEDLLRP
jgi:hypothetical protein